MLDSVHQILAQPVVILLYKSGASGEFVAHALTSTIDQFTKSEAVWENNHRCKFEDYFGRTLTCGPITHDLLTQRANYYLHSATAVGTRHMALSHMMPDQLDFIARWCGHWPVIEITTISPVSECFQRRARSAKIPKEFQISQPAEAKINHTATDLGFMAEQHLRLEWSDIMIDDPAGCYNRTLEFLGCTGHQDQWQKMISDYLQRNQTLLATDHES